MYTITSRSSQKAESMAFPMVYSSFGHYYRSFLNVYHFLRTGYVEWRRRLTEP